MTVKYRRNEVTKLAPLWQAIRDVIDSTVKEKGTTYLPMPNPEDQSKENKARYAAYLKRAIFYGATSRTLEGLIGQVFYKDPTVSIPSSLSALEVSVDGGELTLIQQARESTLTTLSYGAAGLLTDYPTVGKGATRRDQITGKIRPTILMYYPWQIINWRYSTLGARRFLSLLVLEETYDIEDDGFEISTGVQWRVFRVVEGQCWAEVWRENDKGLVKVSEGILRKGNGAAWDIIPWSPIGAHNNDPIPDKPPIADMAMVNLGHYINSADFEDSCHWLGRPTPWGSGLTEDWVQDVWNGELRLGSNSFVPLPAGGQAGLLQVQPNTLVKEAMVHKEQQMVALGAKLVEQSTVARTATESISESIVENSVLSSVAMNVSAAYTKALEFALIFSNTSGTVEFELNTDFEIARLGPQERAQLLAEWQGGAMTWGEYRHNLKRSGLVYEDDRRAKAIIESELSDNIDLGEDDDKSGDAGTEGSSDNN